MFGLSSSSELRNEVGMWKSRAAHFERELDYKHKELCDLRDEYRKLENSYEKLKREHDAVVARLVDAIGGTEYGRCFNEYAERRMAENGVVFTASTR